MNHQVGILLARPMMFSLACALVLSGCTCSPGKTAQDTATSSTARGNSADSEPKGPKKHAPPERKEDVACAFRLGRVYSAIENIHFNFALPDGYIASQEDMEWMAKYLYWIMPRCPRANKVGQEGVSYFVATAGPTPTTREGIMAYEVAGNHGTWRHLLLEGGAIVCVSEEEWLHIRRSPDYWPDAPVVLAACSQLHMLAEK